MGRISRRGLFAGLLCAAGSRGAVDRSPFPDPREFALTETVADIEKRLGRPQHAVHGRGFLLWQFMQDRDTRPHDDDRFDLSFYFEMPSGGLLSVCRDFDAPVAISNLYPVTQWNRHAYPGAANPGFVVYAHREKQRIILAVGVDEKNLLTDQIIVMREAALPRFYGWITP